MYILIFRITLTPKYIMCSECYIFNYLRDVCNVVNRYILTNWLHSVYIFYWAPLYYNFLSVCSVLFFTLSFSLKYSFPSRSLNIHPSMFRTVARIEYQSLLGHRRIVPSRWSRIWCNIIFLFLFAKYCLDYSQSCSSHQYLSWASHIQ